MKKLFLSLISLALAVSAYAQLNTFQEGDVISAEKMNENFQALINSNVLRSTTVNCDDGETINGAIEKGFNDIMVKGTCKENLRYTVWREDTAENRQPSGKLAPRFLKISGVESTNATIEDTSANADSLVIVKGGTTLFLKDIALSGGEYSVAGQRNANVYLSNVLMSGFGFSAITIADSAFLGIDEQGVEIDGNDMGDNGIVIGTGSSGWVNNVKISGVRRGIYLIGGSMLWFQNEMSIGSSEIGVDIYNSRFMNFQEPNLTIQGPSDFAIRTHQGDIKIDSGSTSINNIGGRGIDLWQSKASINNLKLLDFNNTGSGWSPAIQISEGSNVDLENVQITGSTDEALIGIDRGSTAEIRNANISGDFDTLMMIGQSSYVGLNRSSLAGNAIGKLIGVFQLSTLTVRDSSIDSNSRGDGINLSNSSNLQLENVNIDSEDNSLYLTTGSVAQIRGNSNINSANGPSVVIDRGSGVRLGFGPKINSINDSVFEIRKSSWLDMDGFEEVGVPTENLVRQDPGPTISIRDMSFLSVGNGNYIEEVTCFGQSFVSLGGGIINDLSSSCTGDGNSGTSNNSDVGSLSDLQGSWLTTCQADGDSFSTELLEVNETDATISVSIYPDSECTTAEALFTASISNLSVGEDIDFDDGSSGYKFSLIQQGLTITPLFDEMAAQFNQYSLCGKTDWAPNQSTEVMGLSCDFEYPAKDVIQYGAYKILGSSLYLGESSPRGYPPNVDGYPFVKQ